MEIKFYKNFIVLLIITLASSLSLASPTVDGALTSSNEYSGDDSEVLDPEGAFGYMYSKYISGEGIYLLNDWCNPDEELAAIVSANQFAWDGKDMDNETSYEYQLLIYSDANSPPSSGTFDPCIVLGRRLLDSDSNYTPLFDSDDPNYSNENNLSGIEYAIGWHTCSHTGSLYNDVNHFFWELFIPDNLLGAAEIDEDPIAHAGKNQVVVDSDSSGSESVTLDGSGSTDDGTITSYTWKEGTTQIATGETPSVTLSVGTHTITLEVEDDSNQQDTDTVIIEVVTASDGDPIADAGPDQLVWDLQRTGSVSVTLDGSGSSDNGSIQSYVWKEGTTQLGTGSSITVSLSSGVAHTITLTVTDNESNTDTDTVIIDARMSLWPNVVGCDPYMDADGVIRYRPAIFNTDGLENNSVYGSFPNVNLNSGSYTSYNPINPGSGSGCP